MKQIKKITKYTILVWFIMLMFWLLLSLYVTYSNKNKIFTINSISTCEENWFSDKLILVLWAGVFDDNKIWPFYKDRLDTAIKMHKLCNNTILVSADNSRVDYDEVRSARDYLLENWIDSSKIFLDFAWFDTYDSLFRAKNIFGVDKLIVVSQKFHLPRALWIAQHLDLETLWLYNDDFLIYKNYNNYYIFREQFANIKVLWDIILSSNPTYTGELVDINSVSNAFSYD